MLMVLHSSNVLIGFSSSVVPSEYASSGRGVRIEYTADIKFIWVCRFLNTLKILEMSI